MTRKFKVKKENFICNHCGKNVRGDGYTNHCPGCLWSKHVDVYPGDRAEFCGGAMRPTSVLMKAGSYTITHVCEYCGAERVCKTSPGDNFDAILTLC